MTLREVNLAVPPERLPPVLPGDTIRVTTEFDYIGPAIESAKMRSEIFYPFSFLDPHSVLVREEKVFNISDSPPPGQHFTVSIDLLVPPAEFRDDYGLHSSLKDVPGPDIFHEPKYYENIITIMGEPQFSGFEITSYTKV